jgi:hypothetical protein
MLERNTKDMHIYIKRHCCAVKFVTCEIENIMFKIVGEKYELT